MSDQQESTAVIVREPQLPEPVLRRGIQEAAWRTLCDNLYPGANPRSVLMVWDYCAARHLDPLKKPVHIVPMEVKVGDRYEWRDVVMPGVYEHRTTAHRTGQYLGHSEASYGPEKECMGVTAPEWCAMTMYRLVAGQKAAFPVKVFFREVVATKRDKQTKELTANARWMRAPIQMLTKCTEAAGIREAFPEETGGEPTAEEMDGQRVLDVLPDPADIPQSAGLVAFGKLSESLQDTIEKAMEALQLTPGLRLAKLNEYLGVEGVVGEEAAKALLLWCRDEDVRRRSGRQTPKADNSKKAPAAASTGSVPAAPEQSAPIPSAGELGSAPLTAADIPFAGGASEKVGF